MHILLILCTFVHYERTNINYFSIFKFAITRTK